MTITAGIETSTLNEIILKKIERVYRRSAFMAAMKTKKRITYNHSGKMMEWEPRIKKRKLEGIDPAVYQLSFPERNTKMKVFLEWRAYNMGEKISKFARLANKNSVVQIANLIKDTVLEMAADFNDGMGEKLYANGNISGSKDIHGLESIFSCSGTTGFVGNPNGTYAGKSQSFGALGGDWTGNWPDGSGDPEYYAWSPIITDYANAGWSATTKTWVNTWQEALDFTMLYMGRLNLGDPDVGLFSTELLRLARSSIAAKEQFVIDSNSEIAKLGHKTVLYNGLELAQDYACPTGCAYLLCSDGRGTAEYAKPDRRDEHRQVHRDGGRSLRL